MRRGERLKPLLKWWLLSRFLFAVGFVLAVLLTDGLTTQIDQGLFAWDAAFYRDIARLGYEEIGREAIRFFPAYPVSARLMARPLGISPDLPLILLSNVTALVASLGVVRLAREEGMDNETATRSAAYGLLLPPAFVTVMGYAEGPFLVAAVAFLLCLRRRMPLAGWTVGVVGGLLRPQGILLSVAALVKAAQDLTRETESKRRKVLSDLFVASGPVVGTAVFLGFARHLYGDLFEPYRVQESFRGSFEFPWSRIVAAFGDLFGPEMLRDGLHTPFVVAAVVLCVVVVRRCSPPLAAYTIAVVGVSLSATNLNSFERYVYATPPIWMAVGALTRSRRVHHVTVALCCLLLVGMVTLAYMGEMVP
ncbi:MAG: hypothetical protein KatS3mg008_0215 [Acidimicrobiales bacterium]|nr:MAG: hypothetical protein KatS3mg008_0215 [Acidimicrobiales bacterium]